MLTLHYVYVLFITLVFKVSIRITSSENIELYQGCINITCFWFKKYLNSCQVYIRGFAEALV